MGLIVLAFLTLFVLIIDHNLGFRAKYQFLVSKIQGYYIDFVAWLLLMVFIVAIGYLLLLTPLYEIIIVYFLIFLILYLHYVILPVKFFDEVTDKIFKD